MLILLAPLLMGPLAINKIVIETGISVFGPEISQTQACDKALEKAKQEAVRKMRGEPVDPKARGSYNKYVKQVTVLEQRIEAKQDARICKVIAKVMVSVPHTPAKTIKVGQGDTIYSVAKQLPFQLATIEQVVMSLFDYNPSAFEYSNINALETGSILKIPSVDMVYEISADEALKRFDEHMKYPKRNFSRADDLALAQMTQSQKAPVVDNKLVATGSKTSRDYTPVVGQPMSVDVSNLIDKDGIESDSLVIQWQALSDPKSGFGGWESIAGETQQTFTPDERFIGRKIRTLLKYTDGKGRLEVVVTKPTASVLGSTIGGTSKKQVRPNLDSKPDFFKNLDEMMAKIGYHTSKLTVDTSLLIGTINYAGSEESREVARNRLTQEILPDYRALETLLDELNLGPYEMSGEQSSTLSRLSGDFAELGLQVAMLNQILSSVDSEVTKSRSTNKDSLPPALQIAGKYSKDATGFIEGRVTDNVGVVELLVDGQPIAFGTDGRFTHQEYLPSGGKEFTFVAIDRAGLKTTETIRINREAPTQVAKISFDGLNPTTRRVESNNNAIALIVGVGEYSKTAPAEFADRDAQVFYDYANLKLGIPQNRIQTLINDKADEVGLLTGVNKWLKRSVKQGESDVYIFFAGHGLASDDGDTAYLIPYDGAPDFLERTAISRDEVFREVSSVNPRSVTVFLDTCYSGDTRGESRLIAGRPLGIKLQEQSLPAGFTVLTAAGGDQIAKPLKEAQHGMFSYFLMKGMEGDADSDGNNEITARELHSYVRENVVQQSGGSQVPELQGDGERVLVRFR